MGVNLIFLTVPLTEQLPFDASGITDVVCQLIVYISSTALAVLLLRKNLSFVFGRPPLAEQAEVIYWNWQRTVWLLPAAELMMWSRPPTYDFLVSSPSPRPLDLVLALVIQVMLVRLSEELFFCEAGLLG